MSLFLTKVPVMTENPNYAEIDFLDVVKNNESIFINVPDFFNDSEPIAPELLSLAQAAVSLKNDNDTLRNFLVHCEKQLYFLRHSIFCKNVPNSDLNRYVASHQFSLLYKPEASSSNQVPNIIKAFIWLRVKEQTFKNIFHFNTSISFDESAIKLFKQFELMQQY